MFAYPELARNIGEGESSVAAVLSYDGTDYDVTGQFSHRWKRKEVDGQLTTDLPLETITFTMPASQMPDIGRRYWPLFRFTVDGEQYTVRYATGTDPVTFYLVIPNETLPPPKEEQGDAAGGESGGAEQDGNDGDGESDEGSSTDPEEDDDDIGGIV